MGSTHGCHGQPWLFRTCLLLWCGSRTCHDVSTQGCWRTSPSFLIIGEGPHIAVPTSFCCFSLRRHCALPADLQLSSQGPVFPLQLVDLGTHLADDLEEVRVSLHGPTPRSEAPRSPTEAPALRRSSRGGGGQILPLKTSRQSESLPARRARSSSHRREGWTELSSY